jgi:hypothetical protein
MPTGKVGVSRHNARTTPRDNPSAGSNGQPPTVFDGGGGSTTKEDKHKLVGEPPPIKKEGRDFCSADKPCGSLWNTHSNKIALKLHLGYLFGISWPVAATAIRDYGVDHINQNIHETERFVREELAQGRTIGSYARVFIWLLKGVMDAEPELSPEAVRDRDVTLARDFEHLRKPKNPGKDKYAAQYERWKDR